MTLSIQLLSDIHFEHHTDKGKAFIKTLDPKDVDILVLAGDIATLHSLGSLDSLCELYRDAKVLWVHGNHTYYGSERSWVEDASREAEDRNPNLVWLDNNYIKIDGVTFHGTPLWFPSSTDTAFRAKNWAEFEIIPNWIGWVYMAAEDAARYLNNNVKEGDVVITHYLPSYRSVPARFLSSPSNCFFVHNIEDLIEHTRPKLWLHGHTHDSVDFTLGQTRVVANPLGYPFEPNQSFNDKLVIEVGADG